jgi:hypothetical protein
MHCSSRREQVRGEMATLPHFTTTATAAAREIASVDKDTEQGDG